MSVRHMHTNDMSRGQIYYSLRRKEAFHSSFSKTIAGAAKSLYPQTLENARGAAQSLMNAAYTNMPHIATQIAGVLVQHHNPQVNQIPRKHVLTFQPGKENVWDSQDATSNAASQSCRSWSRRRVWLGGWRLKLIRSLLRLLSVLTNSNCFGWPYKAYKSINIS